MSASSTLQYLSTPEKLPLSCFCGRWKASLVRPSEVESPSEALRPRLICDNRWKWGICVCETCRLTVGFPISTYLFVQKAALQTIDDGRLTTYRSSEKVTRSFCSECGATVYYQSDQEKVDKVIDVGMGLLGTPLGPVFRDWVWRNREVDLVEDADDRELIGFLQKGFQDTAGDTVCT